MNERFAGRGRGHEPPEFWKQSLELMVNPGAGASATAASDPAIHMIADAKHAVDAALEEVFAAGSVHCASDLGHAATLARAAAVACGASGERGDRVIALGDDGLVNAVVRGLMSVDAVARPALGIIPYGAPGRSRTTCDFAGAAGISMRLGAALQTALTGALEPVDVGRWSGPSASASPGPRHWFLNMVAGGVLSERSAGEGAQAVGGLAYAVAGVLGLPAMRATKVELRGESFAWSGWIYAVAIGNGRRAGGGFGLCPEARVVDGELDITVIPATLSFAEALELIDDHSVAELPGVPRFRSPWVECRAGVTLHFNIDGQPHAVRSGRFDLLPGALELALPPASPLGDGRAADPRIS
jgi:YegS/Rv2252/BmrU family lipid kinase